ncbi:MAG: magnesium/cobalt transporter CorA [Phycisphaerales bacterium]
MSENHNHRRRKLRFRRRVPPGAPPGTLVADPTAAKPVIRLMAYSAERCEEATINDPAEIAPFLGKWPVVWVNIDGLGDAPVISKIGEVFGLHRLALEDVLNTHQRSKVEAYGDHLYIVCREIEDAHSLALDQISLFLGRGFVVTFQERRGDCLDGVRERIRGTERFRALGSDYLVYALLDAVIDCYFPALETLGERLEALEEHVVLTPSDDMVHEIHCMKRELLQVRRAIWPLRDAVNSLLRDASPLIRDETRIYLRDCHDHVIQLIDMLETYRELGSDLMDIYLSSLSNRLNAVMKVLTIIATIFMPLSFLASLYGMNFDRSHPLNMPELGWRYGYVAVLGVMAMSTIGMLIYFKRKGWMGGERTRRRS